MLGVTEHLGGSYTTGGLIRLSFIASPISSLFAVYPWVSLPDDATMVDIGGGIGQACIKLYKFFPRLRFVIQDLPGPIEEGMKVHELVNPVLMSSLQLCY